MGQARTLTRKIVPATVEIAKLSAAKRWEKYLHAGARRRVKLMLESRELRLAAKEK